LNNQLFNKLIILRRLIIKKQLKKELHYGHEVWVNKTTEKLRRSECLCLNCNNLKPGQSNNCQVAQSLYGICLKENIAMIITRCPNWKKSQS